jgi:GSH-dependent disulfide-bond oxidoreductase
MQRVITGTRREPMIKVYFHHTPNPLKVVLFLEETGLDYELVPVDIYKGEQHSAAFRTINPNGKVPAIVNTQGSDGAETRLFDSTAILLYLGETIGQFIGAPKDRPELLSWLMFVATGLGPFSGQAVHFSHNHKDSAYATNRYRREVERHYSVLNTRLAGRKFLVGDSYSIADMSAWGWVTRAGFVFGEAPRWSTTSALGALDATPNLKRWFQTIEARPAAARALAAGKDLALKNEFDEQTLKALFPQNFPKS